jgi:mutator protein MutT
MSRSYPTVPSLGVGAVVFRDDRVLLVRRGQPPNLGAWIFPGGVVELGERIEEALVREVLEETGWTVRAVCLVELLDYIDRDESGRVRYHYFIADYLCEYLEGELAAGSDVTDAKLVPLTDVSQYKLTQKALEVLEAAHKLMETK